MARVDLWLDSDDIASANTSGFNFVIPDDAVRKGNLDDPNDDKARASWSQKLSIVEAKLYEDETKKDDTSYDCVVAEIVFQVPPDATRGTTADPNAGKQHRVWYRVVPAAMKNKVHAKYKANNFAIGKLSGICRAIWGSKVFPHGSKINFGDYFGGDPAAVVGQTVTANMRANKYNGERRDELTDFIPLEMV
jgi:hypothetical protein